MHALVVCADLADLANCIDEHGSLVTADPVDWIVCFVPGPATTVVASVGSPRAQARVCHEARGRWQLAARRAVVDTPDDHDPVAGRRHQVSTVGATGDMLRVREAIPGKASQMRGWSNCAVLTAFLLGRRSWAWTPNGLYRELLRDKATRRVNADQLLIDQFATVASQHLSDAVTLGADRSSAPRLLS
jgi:hypothetical protein